MFVCVFVFTCVDVYCNKFGSFQSSRALYLNKVYHEGRLLSDQPSN